MDRWTARLLLLLLPVLLAAPLGCSEADDDDDAGDDDAGDDDDDAGDDDDDAGDDDDDDSSGPDDDDSTPDPTWRSALYPADWEPSLTGADGRFLHDFSYAGYRRGETDLPPLPTHVANVLDFGADPTGGTDATAAIQAAIDSLDSGGTVVIPAGSYRCDGLLRVEVSGVVLAGEGSAVSRLWFTRTEGMTDAGHLTFAGALQRDPDLPLAVDGEARSHVVRLENASSLEPGDDIAVGWVITDEFIEDHAMSGTWQAFNGTWRPFFRREVVAVNTSADPHEVMLDIPLRYPALLRDAASVRVETGYLREVGVQDLGLSTVGDWEAAWGLDRTHAVRLEQTADAWVSGVASFESPNATDDRGRHLLSGGVIVVDSKRVTVADSTMGYAQNRGGGGNGYLFEIQRSGEVLVRDSVGTAGRHNFIQNWDFGTSGCVWLRTTSRDGFSPVDSEELFGITSLSEFHHSLAMANLVDDSIADDGWQATNRHDWSSGAGHSATQSVFWNLRGAGLLRSFQFGWGYIIGTEGLLVLADVAEDGLFSPGEGTEPNDWFEGEGNAATLTPASLYEDQLARRLER
jgi:hypothetical protein